METVKKSEEVRDKARVPKLGAARMKLAEFDRSIFSVSPEQGITLDDMKRPEFWSHVSAKMKPGDRIEVISEDNEWFAELIVISSSRQWAKVSVLRFVELAQDPSLSAFDMNAVENSGFEVKWGGNTDKFRVTRNSDKEVVHRGSSTKAEAERWLVDYLKALAK